MTFLDDRLCGRSQHFTFSRRKALQKAVSATLLSPVPRSQAVSSVFNGSVPEFTIGDLVASDWVDEFGKDVIDFGEVLGARYLPEGHSIYPANSWVYYIYWTHSTCGADSCYPCYDGEPTETNQLRLVSHD